MSRQIMFRNVPCGEVVTVELKEGVPHGPGVYVTVKLLDPRSQPELGTVMIGTNFHYVPEEPDD